MRLASCPATIKTMGTIAVLGYPQETNVELVAAWRELGLDAVLLSPADAVQELTEGDVAVGRLDVRRSLDGVEPGLDALDALAAAGVRVLNGAAALLAAHDKLLTDERLAEAGIPKPASLRVATASELRRLPLPVVLKPRFGSWGRDVFRCRTAAELEECARAIVSRGWFRSGGVLAQELLPSSGFDLRLIVAGGETVGAVQRVARPGEWRTNISLGGTIRGTRLDDEARRLGAEAASALGCELVGVDLFPIADGYTVLEVNGAVEFDRRYSLADGDVYAEAADRLGLRLPPDQASSTIRTSRHQRRPSRRTATEPA
jgi:RimK family alpha-L-glutamate ligase